MAQVEGKACRTTAKRGRRRKRSDTRKSIVLRTVAYARFTRTLVYILFSPSLIDVYVPATPHSRYSSRGTRLHHCVQIYNALSCATLAEIPACRSLVLLETGKLLSHHACAISLHEAAIIYIILMHLFNETPVIVITIRLISNCLVKNSESRE